MATVSGAIARAQIEAARQSALALTQTLKDAQTAAAALKGPPTPSQAAANEVRRLANETKRAEAAYKALARATAQADAAAVKSATAGRKASEAASRLRTRREEIADKAGAKEAAKLAKTQLGGKKEKDDAEGSGGGAASKNLKYILKNAGVGRAAMGAIFAAGAIELTKLALGYRGMAQLTALATRAGYQFRSLFRGVDPSPIVRATDRFFQLVNPATASGKALASIFSNVFNGFFSAIEKAEPYVRAFVKGGIIAALQLETAWYELRIALLPLTNAIEDAAGNMDGIETAALAGKIALIGLGTAAAVAAAPFLPLAAAIAAVSAALDQLTKLSKSWDENSLNQIGKHLGDQVLGVSQEDRERGEQDKGRAAYEAGQKTGSQYPEGMAAGMAAGAPSVEAAARGLMGGADSSARKEGKIKSPSRKGVDTGAAYPAGMALGIEGGADDVQDAARKMSPELGAGSDSGVRVAAPSPAAIVHVHHHWPAGVDRLRRQDIESASFEGTMRALALGLGVNVSAR